MPKIMTKKEEKELYDKFYNEAVERDLPNADGFDGGEAGVRKEAAEVAAWKVEQTKNPPSMIGTVVNFCDSDDD